MNRVNIQSLEKRVRDSDAALSPAVSGGKRFRKHHDGEMLFMYITNEIVLHRVSCGVIKEKVSLPIGQAYKKIMSGGWESF